MSRLPIEIDRDLEGRLVIFATERRTVLRIITDVASQVSPAVIANVARAAHEYHEHGGASLATELHNALEDVAERAVLTILKLTPGDALALSTVLARYANAAFDHVGTQLDEVQS